MRQSATVSAIASGSSGRDWGECCTSSVQFQRVSTAGNVGATKTGGRAESKPSSPAAMGADAGNLDHGTLGHKSGRSRGSLERFRDVAAGRLADGTAALADQEHDEVVVPGVIVHAGDEGIAALDAVDEAVVAQKIERAIDRDRCRAPLPGESFDDLVGAERTVTVEQRFEHVAAHRSEPLRAGGAQHF